jgi:acetoacetate decarboxylase
MYLDDDPPITGGPKNDGIPRLKAIKNTLTRTLHYDDEHVAMGRPYKQSTLTAKVDEIARSIGKLNVN